MQPDARLSGDAAALARQHGELFGRLPATVQAFVLVELQKWPLLFAPEQRYHRALLEHLSGLSAADLAVACGAIARVEAEAGIDRLGRRDPARLQDEAQALLRKQRLVATWRTEIDAFFQRVDPALEASLYPADAPRRLIVQLYGSGIAVQPNNLWSRFKGMGIRVPLRLEGARGAAAFLQALFGRRSDAAPGPVLFAAVPGSGSGTGPDTWLVESHEALHELSSAAKAAGVAGLSYDRLRPYRDELMRALYSRILSGVESPQAFAAYARSLKVTPGADALLSSSDTLQAFIRDVFLTGNGTLFVNNTFVEWAAVQALRRAQPRVLVTRFGVRDRLKPFSSLLLFSQPRPSDQIPMIEDPVGSFVDVEQLVYYVWLNAEKSAAYRRKTLYLFLAEDVEDMLAIRSDAAPPNVSVPPATLADVQATMAHWLTLPAGGAAGRPIAPLIA